MRISKTGLRVLCRMALAGLLVLNLLMPTAAGAAESENRASGGLSANPLLGPLSAKWWKWIAEQPADGNPNSSPDGANCGKDQPPGPIFYLPGSFTGSVDRSKCVVPRGKAIFIPIINIVSVQTEEGENAQILWDDLEDHAGWEVESAKVRVDGKLLPGLGPKNSLYRGCVGPDRGCFPKSFTIDLPAHGNVFGLEDPEFDLAVADGFYALIPPLPRGTHRIQWEGSAFYYQKGGYTQSVSYTISVA